MARFICYGWNQKFRVKPLGMRFEVNKEKDRRALSGRKVPENLLLEWFSSNAWWQRLAWGPTVCCILFMLGLLWAPTVSRSLLVKASGSVAPRSLLSLRLFSQGKWRHSLWSRNSQPKFPSMYAYSLSLLQIHNISDKDIIFLKNYVPWCWKLGLVFMDRSCTYVIIYRMIMYFVLVSHSIAYVTDYVNMHFVKHRI